MNPKKFQFLAVLAFLGGAAIFGLPMSVFSENHPTISTVLVTGGIAAWIYVIVEVAKNISGKSGTGGDSVQ